MCIEINAHNLLFFIRFLRDKKADPNCLVPWMLGSQSCEKMFRSLRSMTGTFSTMINFSMFGLLQRLHKLSIEEELQSQSKYIKFHSHDRKNMVISVGPPQVG